jgi:hypothetical protein
VYSMEPAGKPDDERASEEKPSEWVTALRGPLTEEVVKLRVKSVSLDR